MGRRPKNQSSNTTESSSSATSISKTEAPSDLKSIDFQHLSRNELKELLSSTITEKNKIEAVLQSIDNGVFAVDWDGKMILFNQAAEKITGYQKDQIIGHYCEEFLQIIDDKGEEKSADTPLADALTMNKTIEYPLCYLKVGARKKIPISVTYSGVKGLKDALVLGICVFKDLRKEKELEQMKSDFVSMAAHELRTPLTAIRGYLSILDEELVNIDTEYREFIHRALVSSSRLDTLVKNILAVAKIEKGKVNLNYRQFLPQDIVTASVEDLKERAGEKEITVTSEVTTGNEMIYADKERVQEVFTNFLDNAISYTPAKGKIKAAVTKKGDYLEFKITDSGIGLSRKDIRKLFRKFSRIKSEATSNIKGTGLGLYICKLTIQMHRGKIGVSSKGPNQGSSFFFLLPRIKKLPQKLQQEAALSVQNDKQLLYK